MDRGRVHANEHFAFGDLRLVDIPCGSRTSTEPYLSWMIACIGCPAVRLYVYVVSASCSVYTYGVQCTHVKPMFWPRLPSQWRSREWLEPRHRSLGAPTPRSERVLQAAIAHADAGGIEALTMRQLGEMLEVAPMALYRHVANKDDLIDAMVDVVFGEIGVPSGGGDWKTAMRERALSLSAMSCSATAGRSA